MDADKYISEFLGFMKYKVDNNLCTMEELESARKWAQENMEINATIRDISKYYGIPENQIRATISRKLIAKPKRKLLYPFSKFLKIIPNNWHKSQN